MITNIFIKNFKSLRVIDIPVSNINVFTGLNGMGKSTVLQALLLLRQSSETLSKEIRLYGDLVDIGEFQDAICEYPTEDDIIQFKLTFTSNETLDFESHYTVNKKAETVLDTSRYQNNSQQIALFGDASFLYLSANRIVPADSYAVNKTSINNKQLGNRGEYAPHYYNQNCNKDISIKSLSFNSEDKILSLEYQLNSWLGVISPDIQVHTEVNNNLIVLKYSYKTRLLNTTKFKAKNAGFGLTYVFSVLVAILSAKQGDILIIENPESHIHPRGQSELARLLSLAARNGVQIFVETHSDHIIYGLRVAIKEKDISNKEVNICYFDRDEKSHFAIVHPIAIDDYGRIERSAIKYFSEYELNLDKLIS